jgi:hypothetical protein
MYTFLHRIGWRDDLVIEAPCFFASVLLAEAFYKFHSFSLECLAFLATWFLFGAVACWVRRLAARAGK